MLTVLPLAVLVLLLLRLIPVLRQYLRISRMTRDIPGPPCYPLVGSFFSVAGPIEGIFDKLTAVWSQYGLIFKLWLGPVCFVHVADPDDLEVVYTNRHLQTKIRFSYDTLKPMIGSGLININGEEYRRHRKAVTSSLHLQILQDFIPVFKTNAERLVNRLNKYADTGEAFDAHVHVGDCAILNVCETLLSTDVDGLESERNAYMSHVSKGSQLMFWRAARPWNWFDVLFRAVTPAKHKEYHEVAHVLHDYVEKVLDIKWRQVKEGKLKPNDRQRETFVEKFLRSEESSELTQQELLGEVKNLIFAGTDTTVQLLCFFLIAMSLHRNIQQKVQQEVDEVLGDEDCAPQEALPRLQYLERVLREVLRLFPVAPIQGRQATLNVPLPSGHVIPQGCLVFVLPRLVHRDERWFPDALRFDPDRFLPENTRGRHPFAYVPFSAGVRSCVGQKFGMMFVKTVAATLMRNFTVLPDPDGPTSLEDVKFTIGITLSATNGTRIQLQHRNTMSETDVRTE